MPCAQVVALRDAGGFSSALIPIVRDTPSAMPSILFFSTYLLDVQGCPNPGQCAAAVSTNGTVQFLPFADRGYAVVGIWWDALPDTAALRLGLRLEGLENAAVRLQLDATALSVFGVMPGQCPTGTMRPAANSSSSTATATATTLAPSGGSSSAASASCKAAAATTWLDSLGDEVEAGGDKRPLMLGE